MRIHTTWNAAVIYACQIMKLPLELLPKEKEQVTCKYITGMTKRHACSETAALPALARCHSMTSQS